VNFRNLRLRELPASSTPLTAEQVATLDEGFRTLYNGLDFAGWAVPKAAETHWRAGRLAHRLRRRGGGDLEPACARQLRAHRRLALEKPREEKDRTRADEER
jgi:hypothetical protein